jgi:hypothetical protein
MVASDLLYDATCRPNYCRSHFTAVKNDQNLHRVNTSYVTKVLEKQQILIVKNFQVSNWCVMDNHRSKTANIRGFYLAHNTLQGLNEFRYS